jgi:hypothetical protein
MAVWDQKGVQGRTEGGRGLAYRLSTHGAQTRKSFAPLARNAAAANCHTHTHTHTHTTMISHLRSSPKSDHPHPWVAIEKPPIIDRVDRFCTCKCFCTHSLRKAFRHAPPPPPSLQPWAAWPSPKPITEHHFCVSLRHAVPLISNRHSTKPQQCRPPLPPFPAC